MPSGRPELFALVEVGAAGQAEHEHRGGRGPGPAEGLVRLRDRRADPVAVARGLAVVAEAGGVPDDVVVGEHPGAGGADGIQRRQGLGDDVAHPADVQAGVQVREVEGLVHLVRADPVGQAGERVHIGFGAEDAVGTVLGQDPPPFAVDVVQGGLAEHGGVMARVSRRSWLPSARPPHSGSPGALTRAWATSTRKPETPRSSQKRRTRSNSVVHGVVVPVEVRLGRVEEVQVPLARCAVGFGDARPGRAAEVGLPVVRRLLARRRRVPSRKMNMSRSGLPAGRPGPPGKRRAGPSSGWGRGPRSPAGPAGWLRRSWRRSRPACRTGDRRRSSR